MGEIGRRRFETRTVHSGRAAPLEPALPTAIPVHNAASFYYESSEALDQAFDSGYVYSRFANPTVAAFEQAVAELEGADGSVAFGSGMAALHAAMLVALREPDDLLAASRDCYGGTQGLITGPLAALGIQSTFVDLGDRGVLDGVLAARPRAFLLETIS